MTEIEKIELFFAEGAKLWAGRPDYVQSKEFFDLWEKLNSPQKFGAAGSKLTVMGQTIDLGEPRLGRFARMEWDPIEERPALFLESKDKLDKVSLFFDSAGSFAFRGLNPDAVPEGEVADGERFDLVYDIIAHIRKTSPVTDVLNLTVSQFREAAGAVKDHHPERVVKEARRLKKSEIKALFLEACRDMRLDELSLQLTIPLDGTYSAGAVLETAAAESPRLEPAPETVTVPAKPDKNILRELDYLSETVRVSAELERDYSLSLAGAEVLKSRRGLKEHEFTLRVRASQDAPVLEGDTLQVFQKGDDKKHIGSLTIDLFEAEYILGRLNADQAVIPGPQALSGFYAKPPKSPAFLVASEICVLRQKVENDKDKISPPVRAALGIDSTGIHFADPAVPPPPQTLDPSQKKVWAACLSAKNTVSLAQGPPGTGKTFVLEQIIRKLCRAGKKILLSAPSNTAVDNICSRITDLPLLRVGGVREHVMPEVAAKCWHTDKTALDDFFRKRKIFDGAVIAAGTHVGIIKSDIVRAEMEKSGFFDEALFDEAGMSRTEEFLLCAGLAKRALLFGDHKQLPPYPMAFEVVKQMAKKYRGAPPEITDLTRKSAMEWLCGRRGFPALTMESSHRCQNPRLIRFSSTLFYDAAVKAGEKAEYLNLGYDELVEKYPQSTLALYSTSRLSSATRQEKLVFEGMKPGLENSAEAAVCGRLFYKSLKKHPLNEISIITPYRRQTRLLRSLLSQHNASEAAGRQISAAEWENFLSSRISTVDSFQGGESDVVIICYVRSNAVKTVGFVDAPNRINVAHTRARREMYVVCDIEFLKAHAKNDIFSKMARAVARDGTVINIDNAFLSAAKLETIPVVR